MRWVGNSQHRHPHRVREPKAAQGARPTAGQHKVGRAYTCHGGKPNGHPGSQSSHERRSWAPHGAVQHAWLARPFPLFFTREAGLVCAVCNGRWDFMCKNLGGQQKISHARALLQMLAVSPMLPPALQPVGGWSPPGSPTSGCSRPRATDAASPPPSITVKVGRWAM
jgi:hypothetical protein